MQIDFHHAVTYICARFAGFSHKDAEIISHSAQYVDDATAEGEIWFDNGMVFPRIASAHKLLDYKNADALANHRVWLPFHFLPGNNHEPPADVLPAYSGDEFMQRCICRPNSRPARDMMQAVIERQSRPYALYRLGIATHVFMDTWAHQGFVGFRHRVNVARNIEAEDHHHQRGILERLKAFFKQDWNHALGYCVAKALPLGHGAVLSYPDRPYLKWSYKNGLGETVVRDNPKDFHEAAQQVYQSFCRYRDYPRLGAEVFEATYDYPEKFAAIKRQISLINDEGRAVRHARWLDLIASGELGFQAQLSYVDKGAGSWKQMALSTGEDVAHMQGKSALPYDTAFLGSHWKLFHDALQAHRFFVLNELLPKYGLLGG